MSKCSLIVSSNSIAWFLLNFTYLVYMMKEMDWWACTVFCWCKKNNKNNCSKTCVKPPLTHGSWWTILQYFWPALSDIGHEKQFLVFLWVAILDKFYCIEFCCCKNFNKFWKPLHVFSFQSYMDVPLKMWINIFRTWTKQKHENRTEQKILRKILR